MKLKGSTILGCAIWVYFIVGVVLYVGFNVAWVKTFDFVFGFVIVIALSVWYVVDRIRYHDPSRPNTSHWGITPYGWIYRRRSHESPPRHNPNRT